MTAMSPSEGRIKREITEPKVDQETSQSAIGRLLRGISILQFVSGKDS